ncbi:DUF3450 domain-containing protein [Halomonas sp.]|uniref:DUF3450 domain-containing protein n=1 Tax=Halomonas sp. TaxID=1486246 RepID=UPI00356167E7
MDLSLGIAIGLLAAGLLHAQEPLVDEASDAQRGQAELQARIDEADDETRELLRELRRVEDETRRLEGYNLALAPRLAEREATLDRREAALDGLEDTRVALPALNRGLLARLAQWVEQDLPFLVEERRARVASLDDETLPATERLERLLSAWRSELAYGRETDAWRGYLTGGDTRREVDFLRLGRVGLYYLTPDGRQGGVWRAGESRWKALEDDQRAEVRKGLRIARDQRAPELLELPVSSDLETDLGTDLGTRKAAEEISS